MSDNNEIAIRDLEAKAFEDRVVTRHYQKLVSSVFKRFDLKDIARYIEDHTYLNGSRYSFKDHEFQKDIILDTSPTVNVQKCAQVGMSEIMARYALAACRVMPFFDVIMTMPGAEDMSNFFKTRIDPIIADSEDLRESLDSTVNNTTIKGIGTNYLYGRGTRGTTAALSVPADLLIHDEVDRSDPFTLKQYQSRIKHSEWKLTRRFGTPTAAGVGISEYMDSSLRMHNLCKCNHCNHWFNPEYVRDVIIPGFDKDKREINKNNLLSLAWQKAYVACPKCGQEPDLGPNYREWVCENPAALLSDKGYFVTPFCVPNVVATSRIVEESTKFPWHEFCNQTLGLTSTNTAESMTREDIMACRTTGASLVSGDLHAMGVDLGATCYFTIGRKSGDTLLVVHREKCALADLKKTREKLMREYRVLTSVWDYQPYTDRILELQELDPNLYAARYEDMRHTMRYVRMTKDQSISEGLLPLLMTVLNRDLHFDELMMRFKNRTILWQGIDEFEDKTFADHLLEMKRSLVMTRFQESKFTWIKPDNAQDHYHHSLGYLDVAVNLMPTAALVLPSSMPIAFRIKVATPQQQAAVRNSMG